MDVIHLFNKLQQVAENISRVVAIISSTTAATGPYTYGLASYTMLNGVRAARLKRLNPPAFTTSDE
jgi:hypothetical protein